MLSNQSQNPTSDSVPSSPEVLEPGVTTGRAKFSREDIKYRILFVVLVILTIMATCLFLCGFSLKYTWGLVVVLALIMFAMIIVALSGVIHNEVSLAGAAMIITLATLASVELAVFVITKSGIGDLTVGELLSNFLR